MEIDLILQIAAIIFFSAFAKSLSGFGFALVAMSLLPKLYSLSITVPLVALLQLLTSVIILFYYWRDFKLKIVTQLITPSIIGVPLGVYALKQINENIMLGTLGVGLVAYALYTWFSPRLPEIQSTKWAYFFGFLSGVFTGAYNLGGPPIVIYANCCRWKPEEFKSNITGVFLFNQSIAAINHGINQNLTPEVWQIFSIGLIPMLLGTLMGILISKKFFNKTMFKNLVLLLLMISGLRLILKVSGL